MVKRPKPTVCHFVKQFIDTGSFEIRRFKKCGHPCIWSKRDEHLVRRASQANPQATARQIRSSIGGLITAVSLPTIKRYLRRQGLATFRPRNCPSLNATKQKVGLLWCRKYCDWSAQKWRQVLLH
jgi:hypothetical protein